MVTAVVVASALSAVALAQDHALRDQIEKLGPGTAVQVVVTDGQKLRGWIGEISDSTFLLSREKNGILERSSLNYTSIRSIKRVASVKPSHTVRNIFIGVTAGVIAIGVIAGILIRMNGLG